MKKGTINLVQYAAKMEKKAAIQAAQQYPPCSKGGDVPCEELYIIRGKTLCLRDCRDCLQDY
jgi:hypothetical protein